MRAHYLYLTLPPRDTVRDLHFVVKDIPGGGGSVSLGFRGVVQGELSVDVQGRGGAAGRPDQSIMNESVTESKVGRVYAGKFGFQGGPWGLPGKPVGRFLSGGDALFQLSMASVVGLVDGVLVALGVVELDVRLQFLRFSVKGTPGPTDAI